MEASPTGVHAVLPVPTAPPLVIETNGHAPHVHNKRKTPDHDLPPAAACVHLPRDDGAWLSDAIRDTLRRTRQSDVASQWLAAADDGDDALSLRRESVACLTCDFSGQREQLDDPSRCFMTHAILTNHHFALLPRKKKLFCARCVDFVYPDALLALTQPVTPSHHRHSSHHHHHHHHGQSASSTVSHHSHRSRAPALRRRLLRSSARRGFVNMGNTCYMNAVLQALAHNPLLQHEYFVLRSHNTTICEQKRRQQAHQDAVQPPVGVTEPCVACEMSSLLQTLFPAPRATLTARHLTSPVVPQSFMESFWSHARDFIGAHQQDAHEFLVTLLNGIHKHTLPRASVGSQAYAASLLSPRFTPSGHSLCDCVVHQNFAGVFRSDVTCVFCDTASSTYDPFLDISLSLESPVSATPRKNSSSSNGKKDGPVQEAERDSLSLVSLLQRFTKEERLKGVNQIYCKRCSRYVDATKQLVLHKLPNLLVLHLKRLDFHKQRKITDAVSFPVRGLDLREFCGDVTEASPLLATPISKKPSNRKSSIASELTSNGQHSPMTPPATMVRDAVYDLAAVVCHHGDTANGGHFTSYVHASPDEATHLDGASDAKPTQWLHCDDGSVEPVATEKVEESQAYMLLYVRRRLFV